MNPAPADSPAAKPSRSQGSVFFTPFIRGFLLATSVWFAGFFLSNADHMCALGYKTAERLAPFVVATLTTLCVVCIRRKRLGLLLAGAVLGLYGFVLLPAYLDWIHGSGKHHFPEVRASEFVAKPAEVSETRPPLAPAER